MTAPILVVGGTGNVGREVVARLLEAGAPVRALVRNRKRAAHLLGDAVELVKGDLDDLTSLAPALQGVEKIFLCTPADPLLPERERRLVYAAAAAGARHVVKVSMLIAAADSPIHAARWHAESEAAIEGAGVGWTFLEPQFYLQNLLGFAPGIQAEGTISAPMGEGRVSMVDVRDVADVAARALLDEGHVGQRYLITGPESVTFVEIAMRLGRALGRELSYVPADPDETRAAMVEAGVPEWFVDDLVGLYKFYAEGGGDWISDVVPTIAGHTGRTVDHFAADYAFAFQATEEAAEVAAEAPAPE